MARLKNISWTTINVEINFNIVLQIKFDGKKTKV